MRINSTVITNLFLVAHKDKHEASKLINRLSMDNNLEDGIDWTDMLRQYVDTNYFTFEVGIAHYSEIDNPYSEPSMYNILTKKVNTVLLTVLNLEDFPLNKKEVLSREGFIDYLEMVSKSKLGEIPYVEYKLKIMEFLPEIVLFDIPTAIHHSLIKGISKSKKTVELFELDSFKNVKYDLGKALEITLSRDKSKLLKLKYITKENLKELISLGYIEPQLAIKGCFNQALDSIDYTSHPLGLFLHYLQHFYSYPNIDKGEFKEDLKGMINRQLKDIMPTLSNIEFNYIAEYFIEEIRPKMGII